MMLCSISHSAHRLCLATTGACFIATPQKNNNSCCTIDSLYFFFFFALESSHLTMFFSIPVSCFMSTGTLKHAMGLCYSFGHIIGYLDSFAWMSYLSFHCLSSGKLAAAFERSLPTVAGDTLMLVMIPTHTVESVWVLGLWFPNLSSPAHCLPVWLGRVLTCQSS